jgi:acyl carrier protein
MEQQDILVTVQDIMRQVFRMPHLVISESMSAADISQWNSLNHVILISELEKKYDIKFDLSDMLDIRTVQDICDKILTLSSSS